ncbi:fungal hydrophobin [Paecilomyces variotii]|nr:fungal hydrophobin [Paecilomyces variotii]KAJ9207295.1 fungal hydrophobin [Paecilomyces variotii]KAJ9217269.1 fungal hydrophobin [Paecilomyces variotii]KAJ9227358.1 fungal hydrophobin [Paecilomyces variotii]KAJ9240233.1 fungal hydrophobin [Paecilomyces variotii]
MHLFSSNLFILAVVTTTSSLVTAAPPSLKPLPSNVRHLLPTPSGNPNKISTCPADAKRQCCVTLQEASNTLLSGLGDLVPYLSGVEVGSVLGMGCTDIADNAPDYDCRDTIACCSGAELLGPHTVTGGCYPPPSHPSPPPSSH